ncbi:sensor histidine kinase [Dyadobacter subterraneus]|uniref:Histidine kinase n=1 Tax=Dyadobacter subterraneus TaxID=2773304 RepID=A0ABR9WH32_9BACT|nr:histidine kinase [Dyadobacter subterraneus]MBE9464439.1 histidine kinase [Dyadobacter subterraneus]
MWAETLYPLSHKQKWKLGFGFAIIYVPIRIYINVTNYTVPLLLHKFPLWIIELIISGLFYTLWLNVIEWLQYYIARFPSSKNSIHYKFINQLLTLLIAIGLAAMFNIAFRALWHWMESIWDPHLFHVSSSGELLMIQQKRRANNGLTVMALMAAYYLASNVRVYQRLQHVHINAERLEKENIKAHFNALKNQVSPHFLFNNFSVLSTLVETDKELSIEFISRLSQAYRYILEQSDFDQIKLRTEIEFLETYMYLLKTRFEDKINLEIRLSEEQLDSYSIVPLTLQLLVENAVKHNQMSATSPLVITISIEDDFLIVRNPVQLREPTEASTGIGLHNIINRYKLLVNKPVLVEKQHNQFVVKIPLIS